MYDNLSMMTMVGGNNEYLSQIVLTAMILFSTIILGTHILKSETECLY